MENPSDFKDLPLLDFIPAVSRNFQRPDHLAPLAHRLESFDDGEVRFVCHSPPRHGKTEVLLHHIVQSLLRNPELMIGYAPYSADLAEKKSRRALYIAERAGLVVSGKISDWETAEGGGLTARGIGGGWTGRGLDRLYVDDPIKDRAEAESKAYRSHLLDWFDNTAYNRLEPGGSIVLNMTRWHPDDLAGSLIKEGWDFLRIPAVCDAEDDPLGRELGEVLWPERWPLERLKDRWRNEHTKASLFQGRPRPRGATLFDGTYFWTKLPTEGFRVAIGIDLAYTARTHSDWSVAVAGVWYEDRLYITDVLRQQVRATQFAPRLKFFQGEHGGTTRFYHGGGAEVGAVDTLRENHGLIVNAIQATADKWVRAQDVSTAWNEGRVLVPRSAPWLNDFVDEVLGFTGVNDDNDDQVDALAALFDELANSAPMDYRAGQSRRYAGRRRGWSG